MSPSKNHSYIQITLGAALLVLKNYSVFSKLSLDIGGKEYVPDLCLYPKQVFNPSKDEIKTQVLPLLAIEILSPSQNIQELIDKCSVYFASGVKSCWLVLPVACAVMVLNNSETATTYIEQLRDENLGITLDLKAVFS